MAPSCSLCLRSLHLTGMKMEDGALEDALVVPATAGLLHLKLRSIEFQDEKCTRVVKHLALLQTLSLDSCTFFTPLLRVLPRARCLHQLSFLHEAPDRGARMVQRPTLEEVARLVRK